MRLLPALIGSLVVAACAVEDSPAPRADAARSAVEPPSADRGSTSAEAPAYVPSTDGPRVVFLGTSLTAGYGLEDPSRDAWPVQLAVLASEAGVPLSVVNGGVSGDTSAGGLRRLAGLLDGGAAAVVVELGANDGLRGLPLDAMRENLDAAIDTVRRYAPDAAIVVARMEAPPNLGPEYVGGFAAIFDALDLRAGVSVTPFILDGVAGDPSLNQADGIHPVSEGHRQMAATVWPTLRSAMGLDGAAGGG